jgi:UDP-glucuronate 4-epimerase
MKNSLLLTGVAGFIGFSVAKRLLREGVHVVGVDCVNAYYDVTLKEKRLAILAQFPNFTFHRFNLCDKDQLFAVMAKEKCDAMIHLAAQAGVRYSLENPQAYIESNIIAFTSILEAARHFNVRHLVYASSSSVYGLNKTFPFSVETPVNHPMSLYAASKKSNELMAHCYSHLFNIPTTGLRFFTAYGPWGRPDMAMFIFAESIRLGKPINIFNNGQMKRDFTFIEDIVDGVIRALNRPATPNLAFDPARPDPATSSAPYRLYNLGNNAPVELMMLISLIEKEMGKEAIKNFLPLQPGDVPEAHADIALSTQDLGYHPHTSIEEGVRQFIAWYKDYRGV